MTALGSFPVVASAAEVSAFRGALGLDIDDPALPLTFPMRWLVSKEVREAIASMVPEPGIVLVHEGQSFDYERTLVVGEPYRLELSARRETEPGRLVVGGIVAAADGPIFVRLETILRLFATDMPVS